ncbi:GAF domain-containing protein [Pseudonocardia sp. T1-2H]|uniref:GAF domain-containing protein n=1 Tax=Pseudonocardia sp. T1-2H TaxID=3128899 RepID=UPI0031018389
MVAAGAEVLTAVGLGKQIAEEQAALRRVATLVARATVPAEVFAAVTAEVGRLLEVDFTHLCQYDPDGAATTAGVWNPAGGAEPVPGETRWSLGGWNVTTLVFRTGRPARIDDYDHASGAGASVGREWGFRSAVGVPISVEGRLWGFILVAYTHEERLPADTEARLAGFAELVATAIANAEGHAQLEDSRDRLRRLAEEQAALRRVATLVARGLPPAEVFAAVAHEVGHVLDADGTVIVRLDPDTTTTVVASVGAHHAELPVGSRWKPEPPVAVAVALHTCRPARCDSYNHAPGDYADAVRRLGLQSSVAAPITVEGRLWGAIGAGTRHGRFPTDTEHRMAGFTELIATAIANADSRAQLTTSRARIVTAADDARRRIERDLHDSTQQRLVALGLTLRLAQTTVPTHLPQLQSQLSRITDELTEATEELREIARGIHPAILSEGGLDPALRTLARRAAIPVELTIHTEARPRTRSKSPPTTSCPKPSPTPPNTPTPPTPTSPSNNTPPTCTYRSTTTASAAPTPPTVPASPDYATASTPWTARSTSTAPPDTGPRSSSNSPCSPTDRSTRGRLIAQGVCLPALLISHGTTRNLGFRTPWPVRASTRNPPSTCRQQSPCSSPPPRTAVTCHG